MAVVVALVIFMLIFFIIRAVLRRMRRHEQEAQAVEEVIDNFNEGSDRKSLKPFDINTSDVTELTSMA